MKRPRLLFLHGWAFGPSFWDPLAALLPEYPARRLDLGFFGPEDLDFSPDPSTATLAVGHSLGAMLLLAQSPSPFDALISLGGFTRFGVAPGPVRAMRRGLGRDPGAVLRGFYSSCALPEANFPDTATARADRLAWGLDQLLERDEAAALARLAKPLLAVGARDEAVVSPENARASFGEGVTLLPSGGHAFPLTRARECAGLVRAFLESL